MHGQALCFLRTPITASKSADQGDCLATVSKGCETVSSIDSDWLARTVKNKSVRGESLGLVRDIHHPKMLMLFEFRLYVEVCKIAASNHFQSIDVIIHFVCKQLKRDDSPEGPMVVFGLLHFGLVCP